MDPQRQYAQLLTLWSQGSKMFRRSQQIDKRKDLIWDQWWHLGRRLVERGLTVLPVPLPQPYFLVASEEGWFTLCSVSVVDSGIARGRIIAVDDGGPEVIRFQGHWIVSFELALRLGQRGWQALASGPQPLTLRVTEMDQAVTLIGAMARQPELFRVLPPSQWTLAAQLLRHPNRRLAADCALPEQWGFRFDDQLCEAWWER